MNRAHSVTARQQAGVGSSSQRSGETSPRRVREEVRDGLCVAGASVAASVALVLVATLVMRLVG